MFSNKEKLKILTTGFACLVLATFLVKVPGCGSEQLIQESASPGPSVNVPNGCGKVTFSEVKPVIAQNCLRCHPGFDQYALAKQKAPAMIQRINLDESDAKHMPQKLPSLPQDKKDLFTAWQQGGFLEICPTQTTSPKTFYNFDSIEGAIETAGNDLLLDERLKSRFLVLTHKVDQGVSAADLSIFFSAANKAVNSLNTQNAKITKLAQLGPESSILRINLDDFGLSVKDWDLIIANDPFRIESFTTRGKNIKNLFQTRQVWLHFDNFINISHGSADVYYALTKVPGTFDALVKKLGVNFVGDQRNFTANFLGTSRSPISDQKPRLVTQFRSDDGNFWMTFDPITLNNVKARNLFNAPLLIDTKLPFEFAAGEIIFSLRNGLQAYVLVNKNGELLREADPNIVRDVNSPVSSIIKNSLSCFRCHAAGVIPATDELRAHVQANASNFDAQDVQRVLALYKTQDVMDKSFRDYNAAYQSSQDKVDAQPALDPVTYASDRFQLNWDINQLASFLFLSRADFTNALNQSATGKQQLGAILTGGTVSLDVIKQSIQQVIKDSRLFEDPLGK